MSKFVCLGLTILFMLNAAMTTQQGFEKYRKIEAYEIRPGILMMPRYTVDDRVCEIGLERLQYSPKAIRVNSDLSREEILEILDELVPADERGKPAEDSSENRMTVGGHSMTTHIGFDNVSIRIYGATSPSEKKNVTKVTQVVATIKWKQRICR